MTVLGSHVITMVHVLTMLVIIHVLVYKVTLMTTAAQVGLTYLYLCQSYVKYLHSKKANQNSMISMYMLI